MLKWFVGFVCTANSSVCVKVNIHPVVRARNVAEAREKIREYVNRHRRGRFAVYSIREI